MRGRHDAVLPALDPQDGRGDGGDVKAPRRVDAMEGACHPPSSACSSRASPAGSG
jgi:hypothetical protein